MLLWVLTQKATQLAKVDVYIVLSGLLSVCISQC